MAAGGGGGEADGRWVAEVDGRSVAWVTLVTGVEGLFAVTPPSSHPTSMGWSVASFSTVSLTSGALLGSSPPRLPGDELPSLLSSG